MNLPGGLSSVTRLFQDHKMMESVTFVGVEGLKVVSVGVYGMLQRCSRLSRILT